jgi:hypothetical protein
MKRLLTIIALALIVSLANAQNSVTFVVDENLEPLNDKYILDNLQKSGSEAVNSIFHDEGVPSTYPNCHTSRDLPSSLPTAFRCPSGSTT